MPIMPQSASTEPASFAIFDQDLSEEWEFKLKQSACLAVDTEAMGLIHGRDRICLVQVCDPSDNVACIRIKQGQNSAPRLKRLFESQLIEKVFHFARFDLAALANGLDIYVQPTFCTKIASRLARTYSPRHGLKELVMDMIGVELDKQAQSSDWGRVEELSMKQLAYAANDVRFLIQTKNELEKMLIREGRFELAKKCFLCIGTFAELDILKYGQIFEH